MRRLTVSLLSLLLVAPSSLGVASDPPEDLPVGAGAGAGQEAFAEWMRLGKRRGTWYLAAGLRVVSSEGVVSEAYVGRGRCTVHRMRGFVLVACSARVRGREVGVDEFDVHPALESASLRLRIAGVTHTASWTGSGMPVGETQNGAFVQPDDGGAALVGAGLARSASARGRLFGDRVGPGKRIEHTAYLAEGGAGVAFGFLEEPGELDVEPQRDGSLLLRRTLRLRA